MPKAWYYNGLRFECTQCGNCCRNHGKYSYVYLSPREVTSIAAFLGLDEARFLSRYCIEVEGWITLRMDAPTCAFLTEANRCAIYPVRPVQCATWPFWKENLRRSTWEDEVRACCPGIGRGDLVPAPEIERRARATDVEFEAPE